MGANDISINVLELLGMFVGAWLLIFKQHHAPAVKRDRVLLRGENEASVAWIQRCRGRKESQSGASVRLLGVLEVTSGWHSEAKHAPGVIDAVADGISRWEPHDVLADLRSATPGVSWQVFDLGAEG